MFRFIFHFFIWALFILGFCTQFESRCPGPPLSLSPVPLSSLSFSHHRCALHLSLSGSSRASRWYRSVRTTRFPIVLMFRFFFIYLFGLFFILGFCTQFESRCPSPLPLPLTGASVLSLFFASPPCSPPLTLRLLEAKSMLPAGCHRRLSSSLTRELSISHSSR